jgi:hypothetical protein
MRSETVAVGCHRLRIGLFERFFGALPFATGREHAIKLLDELNAPWTLVDARWTPKQTNGVTPDNDSPEIAG